MRMLDPQPHERILDLCCGQGVLTRLLLERLGPPSGGDPGSHHARKRRGHERSGRHAHAGPRSPDTRTAQIVAVDASARLIAAARARGPEDPRVRWVVRDATKLGDLADGTFDAAACVMAVQDVPDTEGLFRELGRALRPGGRAVIVMMHPCFRIPRQSDWGWDEEKKTQYRRIDRYLTPLDVPIATHPGRDPGQQTFFHHRPLHVYLTALGQAGLGVTAAEEPVTHRSPPPGPRHKGQERAFAEIPIFLALRAVRLVG